MSKTDSNLIKLIQQIEQKLSWGDGTNWTGHEFEALREEILEQTGKALSVTTLKRVWGKARQDNQLSKSTLDILAEFAGYNNWRYFTQKSKQGKSEKRHIKPVYLITLGIILLFATAFYNWNNHLSGVKLTQQQIEQISFEAQIISTDLPAAAQYSFDIGALDPEGFEIWQSEISTNPIPLENQKGRVSSTYFSPGYFKAQIAKSGQPLKESPVFISTTGWQALLNKSSLNFPIYLKSEQVLQDSTIHFRKADFESIDENLDYANIWLSKVADNPTIDGNNFVLTTTFRMPQAFKNSPCDVATIRLHGLDNNISFGFSKTGCVGGLNFDFGGETISGQQTDLSGFSLDTKVWIDLKVLNQNNELSIFANEQLLLKHTLQNKLGLLGGISFIFDGLGEVKQVELSDINQKLQLF